MPERKRCGNCMELLWEGQAKCERCFHPTTIKSDFWVAIKLATSPAMAKRIVQQEMEAKRYV